MRHRSIAAPWLLLALAALGVAFPTSAQQAPERSGTLQLIWGDPVTRPDSVRTLFHLLTDDGEVLPVRFEPAAIAAADGPFSLVGRRVSLVLQADPVDPRRVPLPVSEAVRVLRYERALPPPYPRILPADAHSGPQLRPYVTILCKFSDWTHIEPKTREAVAAMIGQYGSADHYWLEVSDGRVDITGPVAGWYTLPKTKNEYTGDGLNPSLHVMAQDCAQLADPDVYFPDFAGVNFIFNTDIGCCAWGGYSGLTVDDSVYGFPTTWLQGQSLDYTGIIAHEIGHTFGLMHSSNPYGYEYGSIWDVMSNGVWFNPPGTALRFGSHTNLYHKDRLGWVPAERYLDAAPGSHSVLLAPTTNAGAPGYLGIRLAAPRFSPFEYYVLEARGEVGYDAPLPGAGVVIHRVGGGGVSPSNVVDLDGDGDPNDGGAILEVGETFVDRLHGIRVRVTGREGASFRLEIQQADYPRVITDTSTREYTSTAGQPLVLRDSVQVRLGGALPGDGWGAWVAYGQGVELLTSSGLDGDWLHWITNTTGLSATVQTGALAIRYNGAEARIPLELRVQPADTLVLGTATPAITDSAVQGTRRSAGVFVQGSGPGAAEATFSASTTSPWITLGTAGGVGSGSVLWEWSDTLAPGVYIDSIRIEMPGAAGSPLYVRDTFAVLPGSELTATRLAGGAVVKEGEVARRDSIHLSMTGPLGEGGRWRIEAPWDSHIRPVSYHLFGTGWAVFERDPAARAPGTYLAPIRIIADMLPADTVVFVDTLVVEPTPLALRAYPGHRSITVIGATEFSRDSVLVDPEGPGSADAEWDVLWPFDRMLPHDYSQSAPTRHKGTRWLYYVRVLSDLEPGVYVDTVHVAFTSAAGAPAFFVDSLTVLGNPRLAVRPGAGGAASLQGETAAIADSARLDLTGVEADTLTWTAAATAPWLTLESVSGIGSGTLRWTRDPSGLQPGMYRDTIRVSAAATGAPALLPDSLRIIGPLAVTSPAPLRQATMGAAHSDTLRSEGGLGPVRWTVTAGTIPPGLALDSLTGEIAGVPELPGTFTWTVAARADLGEAAAELAMTVAKPVLGTSAVIGALLGDASLPADHARFLDLLGNRNGRLDIGDVHAWLLDADTVLATHERQALSRMIGKRQ